MHHEMPKMHISKVNRGRTLQPWGAAAPGGWPGLEKIDAPPPSICKRHIRSGWLDLNWVCLSANLLFASRGKMGTRRALQEKTWGWEHPRRCAWFCWRVRSLAWTDRAAGLPPRFGIWGRASHYRKLATHRATQPMTRVATRNIDVRFKPLASWRSQNRKWTMERPPLRDYSARSAASCGTAFRGCLSFSPAKSVRPEVGLCIATARVEALMNTSTCWPTKAGKSFGRNA